MGVTLARLRSSRAAAPLRAARRALRSRPAPAGAPHPLAPLATESELRLPDLHGRSILDLNPFDDLAERAAYRAGTTVVSGGGPADVVIARDLLTGATDLLGAARELRRRTRSLAIVEGASTEWTGRDTVGLIEIAPDGAQWAPSTEGWRELLHAAGFDEVEAIVGPPDPQRPGRMRTRPRAPVRYRAVLHARVRPRDADGTR
jgi:hypothetical protein